MATSGYKTIKVTDYDSLKFSWERTSYSIANNTSTISWKMQLISTGYGKIISTASKDWKVVVAGKTFSGTNTVGISANSTKTLASGTRTIEHNSDGSKTFSYSFSQEFAIDFNGYVGTKSGSGEGTLNTIPRASVLSVSNGTLGTAQTIKITEYSSGFKHKLKYECGTASGWIIGNSDTASSTLSKSWTPPLSLAKQDTTSGDCAVNIKFTLTTYNGGSKVGDSKTYTKTFKMPSSIKPTVPTITVSDTTNYKSTYGNYVQNKSKIKVVGSASGSYGSTIKSYTVTIDGNKVTHAEPFTSSYSGTRTIKVVATDSRGRTNSATKTITVLAYSKPSFASFSAVRDDIDDTKLKVDYKINYSSMSSKNTLTVDIYIDGVKKETSTKAQDSITINNVSNSTIKNIYAKVTDNLNGTATSQYLTVLAPLRIISVHKTGEGVAIGKRAENKGYFDVAWPTMFRQSITGDVATGSDQRIKKNIKNTDLNIVHKLQPVEYQLIDDEAGRVHYGFIAQDIIKILIEAGIDPVQSGLIGTVPNKDFEQLTLSYSEFIPLLVNDNQRLQQELTDMRNELKELKQLILKGRD